MPVKINLLPLWPSYVKTLYLNINWGASFIVLTLATPHLECHTKGDHFVFLLVLEDMPLLFIIAACYFVVVPT